MAAKDRESFFQFVHYDTSSRAQIAHGGSPSISGDKQPVEPPIPGFSGDGNRTLDVSATFSRRANILPSRPDLILISVDRTAFYVHSHILLLHASTNNLCSLLPLSPQLSHAGNQLEMQDRRHPLVTTFMVFAEEDGRQYPVLNMPQQSDILNVMLHAIYDLSCAHYSPVIDTLIAAVEEMPTLGLLPQTLICCNTPLYDLLLYNAPSHPLHIYALAAHHNLLDLSVAVSPYLLSCSLLHLEDSMAERIDSIYLKRLFFLHQRRTDALKHILFRLLPPHVPTVSCDFDTQQELAETWALASASLAWDARPDTPASAIESVLNPLTKSITCERCKNSCEEMTRDIVMQWSAIKKTI